MYLLDTEITVDLQKITVGEDRPSVPDHADFSTEHGREMCRGEWGAGETVRLWVRAGRVEGDSCGGRVREKIRTGRRDHPAGRDLCNDDHVQTKLALDR